MSIGPRTPFPLLDQLDVQLREGTITKSEYAKRVDAMRLSHLVPYAHPHDALPAIHHTPRSTMNTNPITEPLRLLSDRLHRGEITSVEYQEAACALMRNPKQPSSDERVVRYSEQRRLGQSAKELDQHLRVEQKAIDAATHAAFTSNDAQFARDNAAADELQKQNRHLSREDAVLAVQAQRSGTKPMVDSGRRGLALVDASAIGSEPSPVVAMADTLQKADPTLSREDALVEAEKITRTQRAAG